VGQLLPDKGPDWIGIHHHEQNIVPPSKLGVSLFFLFHKGDFRLMIICVSCKYALDLCAG
jgi:hypothetical protein